MIYDYIIAGAGSSGAVLAARLTEDSNATVLLLEAGPDWRSADATEGIKSANPFNVILDPGHARFRYDDLMATRAPGQAPRQYWRGRGMGGSSTINAQFAIRGIPEDFDWWRDEGCDGWGWEDVLPDFIRLEDDLQFGDKPYHGAGGPIPIDRMPLETWGAVDLAFRQAALDLGYPWSEDHNAPDATGSAAFGVNSRDGVRVTTNDAYLDPARCRPNLTVMSEATVDHLCLDLGRVTGVRALTPDGVREFHAREVIVACGSVHSPGVLIRSGIGPADAVRELGVTPVADLPVGKNLVEHSSVWVGLNLKPEHRVPSFNIRHANCCLRYSSGLAGAGRNDMFMVSASVIGADASFHAKGIILVATYQTFSRGLLQVTSPDPNVQPQVDLNMLSDERDLIRLRDGYKRLHAFLDHPEVERLAESRFTFLLSGADDGGLPPRDASDAAIDAWLFANCQETHHPVGTCRMGRRDDPRSVVDPECRVIGVDGLRVIDASIMPECPRANLHLNVVMLAEHMAAKLRQNA